MVGLDSGGGIRTRDLRVMRCRTGGQVGSTCRSLREISWVREGLLLSNWNHIGTTKCSDHAFAHAARSASCLGAAMQPYEDPPRRRMLLTLPTTCSRRVS